MTRNARIFLHPIGLDREAWAASAEPEDTVVEFPGHGSALALDGPLSMSALAQYVAELITEPADVVGCSLGSMVAQHLALAHPDRVNSLVLMGGAAKVNPKVMQERAAAARRAGMAGVLAPTLTRWFSPKALAQQHHAGVGYARRRLLSDDAETFAAYWEAMAQHDVLDRLTDVEVPTTIVAAIGDRATSVDALGRIAAAIKGAHFLQVPGPHLLPLEKPGAFRRILSYHSARLEEGIDQ